MASQNLPEGTDTIIDDAAAADVPEGTPSFGATGSFDAGEAAEASFETDEPEDASEGEQAAADPIPATAEEAVTAAKETIGSAKAKLGETASGLKGQATDKAREYAVLGKDKATEQLHNVSRLISDAAATVDDKVGSQYGDYARQAADTVKGFATSLEGKDVDELFAQGRDIVKKSPAVAVGVAAALGFVLARIVKSGFEPAPAADNDVAFTPDPAFGGEK